MSSTMSYDDLMYHRLGLAGRVEEQLYDGQEPLSFTGPLSLSIVRPVPSSSRSPSAASGPSQNRAASPPRPTSAVPIQSLLHPSHESVPTPLLPPPPPPPSPPPLPSQLRARPRSILVQRPPLFSFPDPGPSQPTSAEDPSRSFTEEAERRASLARRVMETSDASVLAERTLRQAESEFEHACELVSYEAGLLAQAQVELNRAHIFWLLRCSERNEAVEAKEEAEEELAALGFGGKTSAGGKQKQAEGTSSTGGTGTGVGSSTQASSSSSGKRREKAQTPARRGRRAPSTADDSAPHATSSTPQKGKSPRKRGRASDISSSIVTSSQLAIAEGPQPGIEETVGEGDRISQQSRGERPRKGT
ncbi:hypothetical protein A4X06_0g6406 [Tilletia controversa]|uniref:Uncharacterized protein n=1 Tax=Tilletia controversa TaxID=13291 RepID=A0A8X7MPN5_9BASI|nr:hypothetical protein CF328_g2479 [Tilletia controversa]KAE8243313.1 hypothetical protein A4X06_0g6406 [Tilletia controversa]